MDITEISTISNDTAPEIDKIDLNTKEKFYFRYINKFFKCLSSNKVDTMIDIIESRSTISLRLLDWFITRYSNIHKTNYEICNGDEKEIFYVHIGYKSQLKSYKKKYFDPFRRNDSGSSKNKKFIYYFDKEKTKSLVTTIGQLNFFRWIFSSNIIEYIEKNYDEISKAMVTANKEDKERKKNNLLKSSTNSKNKTNKINKPTPHNLCVNKLNTVDDGPIILSFD